MKIAKPKNLKIAKYLCIGNDTIEAQWLPRWYNVPFDQCIFLDEGADLTVTNNDYLIVLRPCLNKNYDIKTARTEHLLNGGNDGFRIHK